MDQNGDPILDLAHLKDKRDKLVGIGRLKFTALFLGTRVAQFLIKAFELWGLDHNGLHFGELRKFPEMRKYSPKEMLRLSRYGFWKAPKSVFHSLFPEDAWAAQNTSCVLDASVPPPSFPPPPFPPPPFKLKPGCVPVAFVVGRLD